MTSITAPLPPRSWFDVVVLGWRRAALILAAGLALAIVVWETTHLDILADFILRNGDAHVRAAQAAARLQLQYFALAGLVPALGAAGWLLARVRRRRSLPGLSPLLVVLAGVPLPLLAGVPGFEFDHTALSGLAIVLLALALAKATGDFWRDSWNQIRDVPQRTAWIMVLGGWGIFTAVMGFLAHWRFITFHAEPYDTSWETNAVWGIVAHGIPSISVGGGDFYTDGQRMPVPYFDTHAPFIYYLYAPFYAIWKDSRTLLWLQALFMGSGSVGVFLFARRWLRSHAIGALLAVVYLLHPSIQGHCLHDIHANILAIPALLLAAGLMEAKHPRWAIAAAIVTALCREETPLFAACIGLFWMLGSVDRRRQRAGLLVVVASGAILLFVAGWLMPHFGGKPRWSHFSFYLTNPGNVDSLIQALFLNPIGALVAATPSYKLEFAWLTLLPWGFVALRGWKAGWFLLTALALQVPTEHRDFFAAGMNYSAPLVSGAIVMGVMGVRTLIYRRPLAAAALPHRRASVMVFVFTCALLANYLYGNIGAKSYKLEYGMWPYRRTVRYHWENQIGYMANLPAFGDRERALWQAIDHVPPRVPVSTSWSLNPQLSSRDIAFHYPFMGQGHQAAARPNYVILDKLPPLMDRATEGDIDGLRNSPEWRVYYENRWAVIFERR